MMPQAVRTLEPLPFEEAIRFWDGKVLLDADEFYTLTDALRARAFAVSGIAKGEQLATVHAAIRKAVADGSTFRDFQRDCGDIFAGLGWTGKSAHRAELVFQTGVQSAYMQGCYEQLMADRDIFPNWQYLTARDSKVRPAHAAMHGRVWPAGHKMWDIWFPYRSWRVNKWFRCRCGVVGLTDSDVSSRGIATDVPLGRLVNLADDPTARPLAVETAVPYGEQVPVWDEAGALIGYETLVPADADLSDPDYGAELEEWVTAAVAEWPPELAALVLAELYSNKELMAYFAAGK
ncbi:phage minor head protein [Candidatus Electronema sp. JM]|uniref:phage head morphogenesis protein n=1 Tax=Candidatus Electronema sp. JM TaxID=3401571 RepID=UPI003AA97837